jgi:hypothetical protein
VDEYLWLCDDLWPLNEYDWITGLPPFVEAAVRVRKPQVCSTATPCDICDVDGTHGFDYVPDPHALLWFTLRVGRKCHKRECGDLPRLAHPGSTAAGCPKCDVMDCVECWLKEPSDENKKAWERAIGNVRLPLWVPPPPWHTFEDNGLAHGYKDCLSAALSLISLEDLKCACVEACTVACTECEGTGDDGRGNPLVLKKTCMGCKGTGRVAR